MTDPLEEMMLKGNFYAFLLSSWGIIELKANESILKAYGGLSSQDARAEPLLDLTLGKKLILFRTMNVLSNSDYSIVHKFKDKRNNIFHAGGLFALNLTEREKTKFMKLGKRAVDIMNNLSIFLNERQTGRYFYPNEENQRKSK